MSWATSSPGMAISREPAGGQNKEENNLEKYPKEPSQRKKIVVVGLGMVGIAFM
jgi:NADPH-dependent glutamate synthase beta subunit-like oxidoreductase